MRHITREELKNALDNGTEVTLVEALAEKYWRDGHLPGAIQIDHTEVQAKAGAMLPDKGARIVVYCASLECRNSTKAARTLEALGYTDVYSTRKGSSTGLRRGFRSKKS